jgi:hypothetical protein
MAYLKCVLCDRCFLKINPDRGSKAASTKVGKKGKVVKSKREVINPHVMTLMGQLGDFWLTHSAAATV